MTPLKLRTEDQPPPESWFRCKTVIYRDSQGEWRCSEREWERFIGTFERKEKRA